MNIAILRTEQADHERLYNKVEYAAAFHGARVVGYVSVAGGSTFRGQPVVAPGQLHDLGVQMIVAASPLTPELRQSLDIAGWNGDRLLSYATQPGECRAGWRSSAHWLVSRQAAVVGGEVELGTRHAMMSAPSVREVRAPFTPAEQTALTARVVEAYSRAMRDAPTDGPYVIGRNWREFMRATRPRFYDAVARGDLAALTELLQSCLRNEMTTGTLGGREAYDAWVAAGPSVYDGMRQQFNVWRYSVATADVARLASPAVGNPYGAWIDGGIVHPNTFLNDYRAEAVLRLVENVDRPIVVDLGGGFGGFCEQLLAHEGHAVYVGFDLPDNLIVASYLLLAAHPEKRILLYESRDQSLDPEVLREYDVVLMPNFMLPRVPDRSVDVFTNFISLSEMDYGSIVEYLRQVDRVCNGFFCHENLLDNGEGYEFYPVSVFPELQHFKLVAQAPSRWPFFSPSSPHHCHGEVLFVRREIDHGRYLSAPADGRARATSRKAA